jgi:hypothetical protein
MYIYAIKYVHPEYLFLFNDYKCENENATIYVHTHVHVRMSGNYELPISLYLGSAARKIIYAVEFKRRIFHNIQCALPRNQLPNFYVNNFTENENDPF